MNKMRIACLALGIALTIEFGAKSEGANSPTASQVERLAGLGKLWGAIKFFHPYIVERNIDWDSALIQTIPKVKSANSSEEYGEAIDYLLSFLQDPGTHTVSERGALTPDIPVVGGSAQPYVRWTDDRIAIVVSNDFTQFAGNFSKRDAIKRTLAEALKGKGIVLDLRSHRSKVDPSTWWFARQFTDAIPMILDRDVVQSGTRSRMFSGYPEEGDSMYYSASVVQDSPILRGTAANGSARPIAFLIDGGTPELSALFGGLQASGLATVVAEGPPGGDAGFDTYEMLLPDGLKVDIRVSELVNPDGSVGLHPDVVVPRSSISSSSDPAMESALSAIRKGIRPRERRGAGPEVVSYHSDSSYPQMTFPAEEYRLLALFRFWNVMLYFHAYQDLLDEPWDKTLTDFIPLFEADRNAQEYAITVAEMVTHIQDSHGFVNSKVLQEYLGTARPGLEVRSIGGQTVVTRVLDNPAAKSSGIAVGDIIQAVDGEEITARRQRLGKLFAASTPQALRWRVDDAVLLGHKDTVAHLRLTGAKGERKDIEVPRLTELPKNVPNAPIFRVLPEGFGYIDLTRLMPAQIDEAFSAVRGTPAVIFDMRGYPNGVFYLLGAHLIEKRVVAARFETPVPQSPDPDQQSRVKFLQYAEPDVPKPSWKYTGKVVVLIDERAISQAEHTGLFLEAMTHATFIGTPTNGANGDVTSVVLPGDIRVHFTGHDIRHADGRQLQRVGIPPDVRVEPTIEGIREGRDEVLQAAVKYLRGQP